MVEKLFTLLYLSVLAPETIISVFFNSHLGHELMEEPVFKLIVPLLDLDIAEFISTEIDVDVVTHEVAHVAD